VTHRLNLFDTPESLATTASSFFNEGYAAGGNLLVVAKPANRAGILGALQRAGCFPEGGNGHQRLVALDAREILERITRDGAIDARLFETAVVPVVERLAATGPLSIYGEIVELLAEQGDFSGAIRLEQLWNTLAEKHPFTLLCGYSSAHFTASESMSALRDLCGAHTHSTATTDDTLGRWLLATAEISPSAA
jgi:hypothetical protein